MGEAGDNHGRCALAGEPAEDGPPSFCAGASSTPKAGDVVKEVDTLGGYLVTRAGRLPVRGELIPGPGLFEFEVLDADPRRIKRVRITRLKDKRERPREQRKRGEPDAVLAGTTPPVLAVDDATAQKDAGPLTGSSTGAHRP